MEEYASGRLPQENCNELKDTVKGEWTVWHDEGGRVQALFRILCLKPLLGNKSSGNLNPNEQDRAINLLEKEKRPLYLTPYQAAPLELHVGHSECEYQLGSSDNNATIRRTARSFYLRRKELIEVFYQKLEVMDLQ